MAVRRLHVELSGIMKDPIPHIHTQPNPDNILEWHYVLLPAHEPYAGGCYHGKITFPEQYPFKPPSIRMLTPSGRFQVNTRLCLSMSDFHPETWQPSWSVSSILTGLLSFMLEESPTHGSVESTAEQKRQFARESWAHNQKDAMFVKLFGSVLPAPPADAAVPASPGLEMKGLQLGKEQASAGGAAGGAGAGARAGEKIGPNKPCHCQSGKKYKKCHGAAAAGAANDADD
eukprot:m.49649 g.49649  ORF g.49649 m.49649 type:complete len:230 (+) comp12841_c0_seq1:91-780(+)